MTVSMTMWLRLVVGIGFTGIIGATLVDDLERLNKLKSEGFFSSDAEFQHHKDRVVHAASSGEGELPRKQSFLDSCQETEVGSMRGACAMLAKIAKTFDDNRDEELTFEEIIGSFGAQAFDANGDGKVTAEEIPGSSLFDSDGNGHLSKQEVKRMVVFGTAVAGIFILLTSAAAIYAFNRWIVPVRNHLP